VVSRLKLFYSLHNPDKVKDASIMALQWAGKEELLDRACRERYGAGPLSGGLRRTVTPGPLDGLDAEEVAEVFELIDANLPQGLKGRRSSRQLETRPSQLAADLDEVNRWVALVDSWSLLWRWRT
jgi:hypothetical protein